MLYTSRNKIRLTTNTTNGSRNQHPFVARKCKEQQHARQNLPWSSITTAGAGFPATSKTSTSRQGILTTHQDGQCVDSYSKSA